MGSCNTDASMEQQQQKLRHLAVSLRDARADDNAPILLTVFLPASIDVKAWEQKLGHRPQSRISQDGEYMQNLSRASDNWQQFQKVAASAQHLFRQILQENRGKLPGNGLVMFLGSANRPDVAFEPPTPVQAPVHLCDAKYHVEYLSALACSQVYGFLIVDGSGCLCGTLSGHDKRVKERFSVDLPKKHSKGGQSALRFARLRLEKRHNYLRKVTEVAKKCFISGEAANISALIIAGSAEFKHELAASSLLDPRLHQIVLGQPLDIAYGGEPGFDQAISLSAAAIRDTEFVREKQVISNFLGEIAKDRGMYCFGARACMMALEMGIVETLLVWNELPLQRLEGRDAKEALYVNPVTSDAAQGSGMHVEERLRLVDWIIDTSSSLSAKVELVSDRSQEGSQFCKGFGGIGGILRYAVELELDSEAESEGSDSDSDFA